MSEEDNTNQDNMPNLKGKTLYKDLSGIHTFYPNIKLIYQNEFCNKLNKISQNEPFDETQTNNNEEMNNGYDINNEALNNYSKDTVESQKTQTEISLDNNPELKNFNEDEELTQTKDINQNCNNIKKEDVDKMDIANKNTQKSTGCKNSKSSSSNKDNNNSKKVISGNNGNNSKEIFSFQKVPEKIKVYNEFKESSNFKEKKKKIIKKIKEKIELKNENNIKNNIKEKKNFKLENYERPLFRKFKKYINRKRKEDEKFNEKYKDETFWALFFNAKKKLSDSEKKSEESYFNYSKYNQKLMYYLFKKRDIILLYSEFKYPGGEKSNKLESIDDILRENWDVLYCEKFKVEDIKLGSNGDKKKE